MNKAYGAERSNPDPSHIGFIQSVDQALTGDWQTTRQISEKSRKLRGLPVIREGSGSIVSHLFWLIGAGTVEMSVDDKMRRVWRKKPKS